MRLLTTAIVLAILFCIPFVLWGGELMHWFSQDAVGLIRGWGPWGWLAVIGLLISDLLLPIPATPVMAAAGFVYGPILGGLISAIGSFCSGLTGYGLCRAFGRGIATRLAGEKEMTEHETLFQRSGPWLVAASRWLPLLPEVVACLAGLTRMPLRIFLIALACGSVPLGFVHAAIGSTGRDHPWLAVALSVLLPVLLWAILRPLLKKRQG